MSYRSEFPDFGVLDVAIPAGFKDESYRNDVCPKFASDARGLVIWVDYKRRSKREYPNSKRFSISKWTSEGAVYGMPLLETDSWAAVLSWLGNGRHRSNPAAMDGHTFVVIAHGKDGEVAYRGREAHLSYGAAWREAQIVARRRGLTDVHIVKDGQHIVGEIKARKNPSSSSFCPCGCAGKIKDHDDRGWGPWNCPRCGYDSDADFKKPCSECRKKPALRIVRRPNPVKTFFCFPCGRRFIATGRAVEANCPNCHRVCHETKMKHRSNPRRRARRGR